MQTLNEAFMSAKARYQELLQQEQQLQSTLAGVREARFRQEGFLAALQAVGAVDEEEHEHTEDDAVSEEEAPAAPVEAAEVVQ